LGVGAESKAEGIGGGFLIWASARNFGGLDQTTPGWGAFLAGNQNRRWSLGIGSNSIESPFRRRLFRLRTHTSRLLPVERKLQDAGSGEEWDHESLGNHSRRH
jgi:hypothetical protein